MAKKKTTVEKKELNRKKGEYYVGKAQELPDPALQSRAREYRRRLSGSMRSLSVNSIRDIPNARGLHAIRKYDGEFTYVVFDGTSVFSVNPGGTVRAGLPCFVEAEKALVKAKVRSCVLSAELYVMGDLGTRNAVQAIVSLLRNPRSESDLKKIGLAIFDIVDLDGEPVETVSSVFKQLKRLFGKGKLAHPAEMVVANSLDAIEDAFTDWVIGEGAEGIVVRHDRLGYYKIKLRHNIDAAIIGFSEGTEARKGMLHDLLVAVMRPDNTYQELTRVGGGFTEDERKTILKDLQGRIVPSEYVAVNNDYVAYEMIEPGPVIELSFLDLIAESTKGDPIKRMVLDFDGKRYAALERLPLVSVISPQFVRIRDDKEANVEDVNIRQVTSIVTVPDADKRARTGDLEPSELLERSVYTKTMKGASMVRKVLLWKTNKEDTGDYPAYVVYGVDFSPNRQVPLERDVRIGNSKQAALRMFDELSKKYFVGGWERAS